MDQSAPQSPDRSDQTPDIADPAGEGPEATQQIPDTPLRNAEDAEGDEGISPFLAKAQFLGLNTTTPIVSYMDDIYTCTWTDLIGTNMFLTQPGLAESAQPLHSTADYDLIGKSRIKLVAQKAKVSKKDVVREKRRTDTDGEREKTIEAEGSPKGRSLGGFIRTNSIVNQQIKNQAAFLEKMMDIKRRRGERDIVRAYVDEKSTSHADTTLHETRHDEMDELSRKVVKGDAEALAKLREISSQLEHRDPQPQGTAQKHGDEDT